MGTEEQWKANLKASYDEVERFLGEKSLKEIAEDDFKCLQNISEENRIQRWLNYKAKENKYYECDGCGENNEEYLCKLSRAIYRILWNWDDKRRFGRKRNGKQIINVNRYGSCVRYEGQKSENVSFQSLMGPDTINSFSTTYKLINDGMSVDLMKFATRTHCLGNFVLVPARFNSPRGKSQYIKDYWDLSLFNLKLFGYRNCDYELHECSFKIEDFNKYINLFFLWDYVDGTQTEYVVKSLLSDNFGGGQCSKKREDSHFLYMKTKGVQGGPLPQADEINTFLINVNRAIKRRGVFMAAMLKIAMTDKKNNNETNYYKTLQEKVFCEDSIYTCYDEVFEKLENVIEECNKNSEVESVKKIIKDAKQIICGKISTEK